jgi:hypothetical protein
MFVWDIVNEKYHKGNPYIIIIKIIGKNDKLVINYLNNLIEFTFTKYANDGLKKYVELTSINKDERTDLHNLKMIISDNNKNIYISNISKSNKLSGKNFVKLAEIIAKKIGASYVYLYDGTSALCKNDKPFNEVDLSLYLLLKNKKTYYQSLGYNLDIESSYSSIPQLPDKSAEQTLKYFLKKINKLDLSNIRKSNNLVLSEIKKSIILNEKIKIKPVSSNFKQIDVKNNYILYNNFLAYSNIYTFLPKKGNLVKELLKIYSKNCNLYNYIINMFNRNAYSNNELGFIYEFSKNTYKLEEIYLFSMLINYRENINWTGYFVKNIWFNKIYG